MRVSWDVGEVSRGSIISGGRVRLEQGAAEVSF